MICPNCKRLARSLIIRFDKEGKKSEGCRACNGTRFRNLHVYTGRKLWSGEEAYGRDKCAEMAYDFEQRMIEGAARNRRRVRFGVR